MPQMSIREPLMKSQTKYVFYETIKNRINKEEGKKDLKKVWGPLTTEKMRSSTKRKDVKYKRKKKC